MFYITNGKINKHNIYGAKCDTKLYPFGDALELSQTKIQNFSIATFEKFHFSKTFHILESSIINFHNSPQLSETHTNSEDENLNLQLSRA